MDSAAQAALDNAVRDFVSSSGDRGVITTYIMVAHVQNWGDRGQETSSYVVGYQDGSTADHVAMGLLDMAKDIIRGIGRYGRDDEDDE